MPRNKLHALDEPILPREVQKAIAQVAQKGNTAKVSRDRKGEWHIQQERITRVDIPKPQP